jgi:hypothetical protein
MQMVTGYGLQLCFRRSCTLEPLLHWSNLAAALHAPAGNHLLGAMQIEYTETLHKVLELCLTKLDCGALAAIARSSKDLHAAVQALVRSSTAGHMLHISVRNAALCETQHQEHRKHAQAVRWLCELGGFAAAGILQGSTAAALLATPFVHEETAAILAAAGLRFTFEQVVEACARPVAGAWVWIRAGAVPDAPELAQLLLFDYYAVSAAHTKFCVHFSTR